MGIDDSGCPFCGENAPHEHVISDPVPDGAPTYEELVAQVSDLRNRIAEAWEARMADEDFEEAEKLIRQVEEEPEMKCRECGAPLEGVKMHLDDEADVCMACWNSYPEVLKAFTGRLVGHIARLEVAPRGQDHVVQPPLTADPNHARILIREALGLVERLRSHADTGSGVVGLYQAAKRLRYVLTGSEAEETLDDYAERVLIAGGFPPEAARAMARARRPGPLGQTEYMVFLDDAPRNRYEAHFADPPSRHPNEVWSKDGKTFLDCGFGIPCPTCDCNACRWEYGKLDFPSLEEAIKDRSQDPG